MSDDFDMVAMETVSNQYLGGDTSLAYERETITGEKFMEILER